MNHLRRQDAKYNLWDAIHPPLQLRVENKQCANCNKTKSAEFYYREEKKTNRVYACSLTCFRELQKK